MTEQGMPENEIAVPPELQQTSPRKVRFVLGSRSLYYLVGGTIVSAAIAALIVVAGSLTPKEIRDRKALKRDGRLTYTNDVQAGGMRSATVFYTFTYNGQSYSGKAFLPSNRLGQVENYSKVGRFPILFLPRDPSISHPYDWDGSGFPPLLYILIALIIAQWIIVVRSFLSDLRLARDGVAAIGRVKSYSYGKNGGIYLRYEFRDTDGLLTEGRGEYPTRQKQDARICVLYLPDESAKSRPYPLVFFRPVQ